MVKPVKARSRIQTYSSMIRPVSSATMAPDAAKAPKARTWPARRTRRGAKKQPVTKPPAQAVPIRPSEAVEKPFHLAAQRQQQAMQAGCRQQEGSAAKQRKDRPVGCEHFLIRLESVGGTRLKTGAFGLFGGGHSARHSIRGGTALRRPISWCPWPVSSASSRAISSRRMPIRSDSSLNGEQRQVLPDLVRARLASWVRRRRSPSSLLLRSIPWPCLAICLIWQSAYIGPRCDRCKRRREPARNDGN